MIDSINCDGLWYRMSDGTFMGVIEGNFMNGSKDERIEHQKIEHKCHDGKNYIEMQIEGAAFKGELIEYGDLGYRKVIWNDKNEWIKIRSGT